MSVRQRRPVGAFLTGMTYRLGELLYVPVSAHPTKRVDSIRAGFARSRDPAEIRVQTLRKRVWATSLPSVSLLIS
jgi:hypothetical protein